MYSWLIGRVIRSLYRKMLAGKPEAVAALAARQVELVVPGSSPLAGEYRGKAEYESWLRRFTALGPTMTVHDVVASGGPWNTRVAVRLTESIGTEYRNEAIDYLRLRWGKLRYHQIYLDTEVLAVHEIAA